MKKLIKKTVSIITVLAIFAPILLAQVKSPTSSNSYQKEISTVTFEENGKWGLKIQGKKLPAIYDKITELPYNVHGSILDRKDKRRPFYWAYKDEKVGLLDRDGEILLDIIYDVIGANYMVKNGKYGVVNINQEVLIPFEYDDIKTIYKSATKCSSLYIVKKNGLWGLSDSEDKGNLVFRPEYKRIDTYYSIGLHYIEIVKENDLRGLYYVKDRKLLIPIKYDAISSVSGYLRTKSNKKGNGKTYFKVYLNGKKGILDKAGKILIPVDYQEINFAYDLKGIETIIAKKNNKYGLINLENTTTLDFKYERIESLALKRVAITKKGKVGLANINGKILLRPKYDDIGYYYNLEKKARIVKKGLYGFIDDNGKIIEPIKKPYVPNGYTELEDLYKNFVRVIKSGNEVEMRQFCKDICPGNDTKIFMEKAKIDYRGFPNKLGTTKEFTLKFIQDNYYDFLKDCYVRFSKKESKDFLRNLEYIKADWDKPSVVDARYGMKFIETIITLKSGEKEKRIKLGEMIQVDGVWKSFTYPRLIF